MVAETTFSANGHSLVLRKLINLQENTLKLQLLTPKDISITSRTTANHILVILTGQIVESTFKSFGIENCNSRQKLFLTISKKSYLNLID